MKQTKNKNGFTLVELIVVVTILSILSTFAYVSFQGYTRDARNAQRTTELRNLTTQIDISLVRGVQLFSLVNGTGSTITSQTGSVLRIGGREGYNTLSGIYKAGDINHTILGLDTNKFLDPLVGVPYKIGVTTHGQRYQVAATIETDFGGDSLVNGNYFPRTSLRNRVPLDSTLNNTGSTVLNMREGVSFLESGLIIGDIVGVASGSLFDYTIVGVDGNQVFITPALQLKGQNLFLKGDEARSLIRRWHTNSPIDFGQTNNQFTPYRLR